MKVGVLGSGDVAKVLAAGFLKHGHSVMVGTRDSSKLEDWASENPLARVGNFADTAGFAEVVVLAVKGTAASSALGLATAQNLAGKPVIDATNPIADLPPVDGVLQFFTGLDESLMEETPARVPGGSSREGVQFCGQCPHDRPAICRRAANHVHLRE